MGTHCTFIATYVMASGRNGWVYIGSSSNLHARVWQHKNGTHPDGYSAEHGCVHLVWYEQHQWVVDAIRRERRLKKWMRDWKLKLIEDANPEWLDLAADWYPVNDPNWEPPTEED
jgi:putative endonuclease